MIKYTLKCPDDHRFESWFASSDAFDRLLGAGMLACTECGSTRVAKAMMAPRVRPARAAAPAVEPGTPETAAPEVPVVPGSDRPAPEPVQSDPARRKAALEELRRRVEAQADYVGGTFAKEARAISEGTAPARPIYGEATGPEVRGLLEDGVQVAPLPFLPKRKVN